MKRKRFQRITNTEVECWFDGACWPNPGGHASCGAVVKRHGVTIYSEGKYLGRNEGMSNNVAEYSGAILVLEYLLKNGIKNATIFGDSNMVVQQMNRRWRVKDNKHFIKPRLYIPYYQRARELHDQLECVRFVWIPRDQNVEADALSTRPLRERNVEERYLPRRNPKDFNPRLIKKAQTVKVIRDGIVISEH